MIRVGIGGWTFEPWRGTFFPDKLPHARELAYASRQLSSIEINGTFYRTQSAASFGKWRDETPDGFVFSVKGHRTVTNRARLAEAGESVAWFIASGILELGDKLGPLLWQMAPTKKFDAADFAAFLALLPPEAGGRRLRHAVEVRHPTFVVPEAVELAARAGVAIVFADSAKYPAIPDTTADFVYARLQNAEADQPAGYPAADLDRWHERARAWEAGGAPADLVPVTPGGGMATGGRDVFVYMINGAKERAPAAAMALIERLGASA